MMTPDDMQAPKGRLHPQVWMIAPETQRVMHALIDNGGSARFVGGCVRNALCNRPVIDIDIATSLKPDEVIARLVRNGIDYAPTGLKHGTVTAVCDGKPFEITTLRRDVLTFGRHAEVAYTDDWTTDAARRDFTINAMFASLDGAVYDPFGGMNDLRLGRVVFVGDPEKRIAEDVLRILRFFRFYAHFGQGAPDAAALAACSARAADIRKLSGERLRQETLKILESQRASLVWREMIACGVVTHYLPEADDTETLSRLLALEDEYAEKYGEKLNAKHVPLRRLAALLHATPAGVDAICAALKLSNLQGEHLHQLALSAPPLNDSKSVRQAVYRLGHDITRSLLLLKSARTGESGGLQNLLAAAVSFDVPRFPVEGRDLMNMGWKEGPDIGLILSALESWWVDQDFKPSRADCLDKLKTEYAR